MNDYQRFAAAFADLIKDAKKFPLGAYAVRPHPTPPANAPVAAIFAPHPDDEVIIGALALRLMRESGWRVVDVPVTLGSNLDRRAERLKELTSCTDYIGFDLFTVSQTGLNEINAKGRKNKKHWSDVTAAIVHALRSLKPRVVFFPHAADWNATHIGTHNLVMDALKSMPQGFSCYTVETEYWAAMPDPNLMVEVSETDLGDLLTALSFHEGELKRSPYHVGLPAWMIDNVRRGSELLAGKGATAFGGIYAVLYRVRKFSDGKLINPFEHNKVLPAGESPASLFA